MYSGGVYSGRVYRCIFRVYSNGKYSGREYSAVTAVEYTAVKNAEVKYTVAYYTAMEYTAAKYTAVQHSAAEYTHVENTAAGSRRGVQGRGIHTAVILPLQPWTSGNIISFRDMSPIPSCQDCGAQ